MMSKDLCFDKPNREQPVKIYTKTGDRGETSLVDGTRVKKSHPRVEAYGTVDELNSVLGVCIALAHKESLIANDSHFKTLEKIQNTLFNLGSRLACEKESVRAKLPQVSDLDITEIENSIDHMTQILPVLKEFILPGGHPVSAFVQQARTICRRAERHVLELDQVEAIDLKYLNRLSDHLFTLARYVNHLVGAPELKWQK